MRVLERYLILQIIDQRWREHLYDMDYLREGIHLRGFAQIEPLVAYKNEAFTLFQDLMNSIWSDFARMIYNVEVEVQGTEDGAAEAPPEWQPQPTAPRGDFGALEYSGGTIDEQPTAYADPDEGPARAAARRPASRDRERDDRPQRSLLVRLRQEVQEVPRGLNLRRRALGRATGSVPFAP